MHGLAEVSFCIRGALIGGNHTFDVLPCQNLTAIPEMNTVAVDDFAASVHEPAGSFTAFATLTACNVKGQCTTARTPSLAVDRTDPTPGVVADALLVNEDWEDVVELVCDGVPALCASGGLLIDGSSGALLPSQKKLDPLTQLAVSTAPTAMFKVAGKTLAATWSGFADIGSGLASAELCVGTSPGAANILEWTAVPLAGMAIMRGLALEERQAYYTTVRVHDHTGGSVEASGLGAMLFVAPPVAGQAAADSRPYVDTCGKIDVTWGAFTDASCESVMYSLQVCSPDGDCKELPPLAQTSTWENETLVSPPVLRVESTSNSFMLPSVRYRTVVSAVGCGRTVATSTSTGVVCDETAPNIIGEPTLRAADGSAALTVGGQAFVSFQGVFHDAESPIRTVEMCLLPASADLLTCGAWVSIGANSTSFTATLEQSRVLADALSLAGQAVVVVRVANAAGRTAQVATNEVLVSGSKPHIEMQSFTVGGFDWQAQAGSAQLCALDRTESLVVRWELARFNPGCPSTAACAEVAEDGASSMVHKLHVGTIGQGSFEDESCLWGCADEKEWGELLVERTVAGTSTTLSSVRTIVAFPRLRFTLVVTDAAGLSSSVSVDCVIDDQAPAVASLALVADAAQLPEPSGAFLVSPEASQLVRFCTNTSAGPSGVASYLVALADEPTVSVDLVLTPSGKTSCRTHSARCTLSANGTFCASITANIAAGSSYWARGKLKPASNTNLVP